MAVFFGYGQDLFNYDQQYFSGKVLWDGKQVSSKVEYDEYVVYDKPSVTPKEQHERRNNTNNGLQVTHRFSQDEKSGASILNLAFRCRHRVDREVFHVCFRHPTPSERDPDQLSMTAEDLVDLCLHPATLQYSTRVATESRFWSRDRSTLSLILSFSETYKTPCDFLSMSYHIATRSTTILIRQSFEPRRHRPDDLDEYDERLESCRDHWAHPLVMPVILLQVQFTRCEETVAENSMDVIALEQEVSSNLGFNNADPALRTTRRRFTNGNDNDTASNWGPMNMTNLMKQAHDVLRGTIKLLDTIRWVERAAKLLVLAGDELAERLNESRTHHMTRDLNMGGGQFGLYERNNSRPPSLAVPDQEDTREYTREDPREDPRDEPADPPLRTSSLTEELGAHWYEIRQYLEALLRLSMSLETERRMAEARCRAQIDIIYSRMAQEDNALNARMAVTSSRDSASMKALAVITAVFLPGEFIGTLFGMSMFDWLAPSEGSSSSGASKLRKRYGSSNGGGSSDEHGNEILSRQFWVYWIICIPLTLIIIASWRAWWVNQDRYFRRHLSRELSEERYWTDDGKPRDLQHSFIHDFFYLSSRRAEKPRDLPSYSNNEHQNPTANSIDIGNMDWGLPLARRHTATSTMMRQKQILDARQKSLRNRSVAI
ncbi:hypothetical protein GMORB2_7443 [Geosmithia morbida]|uniref:Uncharacterized protein n=1 Tax=Geosmithia morbida TaxID=1094350 RepID=A0A9P4YSS6_9HYPO|nr:uncharacterized protein GMORB2_7443 [Geosmithia morbida]KAF4122451.1 hypothetical protein GMORB2_7443 [Geosmithia morbida]